LKNGNLIPLVFNFLTQTHTGDRLRIDLRKKDVPAAKMVILEQKFDEARQDGLLLPSALSTAIANDEPDNVASAPRPIKLVKRMVSATARKPLFEPPTSSGDTVAGAVTAEIFEASFELVPQLTIFGQRDLDDHMKSIYGVIGDNTMDWEKRVDAVSDWNGMSFISVSYINVHILQLKKIRSMLIINIQNSPSFPQQLKDLSIAFLDILKELRSQVIREACITIAYMSKLLRLRVDNFCIYIFQEMINLIQNSAKVNNQRLVVVSH
jgi:CLIP-associating protein 1/2